MALPYYSKSRVWKFVTDFVPRLNKKVYPLYRPTFPSGADEIVTAVIERRSRYIFKLVKVTLLNIRMYNTHWD